MVASCGGGLLRQRETARSQLFVIFNFAQLNALGIPMGIPMGEHWTGCGRPSHALQKTWVGRRFVCVGKGAISRGSFNSSVLFCPAATRG